MWQLEDDSPSYQKKQSVKRKEHVVTFINTFMNDKIDILEKQELAITCSIRGA